MIFEKLIPPSQGGSSAWLAVAQNAGAAKFNYGVFINDVIEFIIYRDEGS